MYICLLGCRYHSASRSDRVSASSVWVVPARSSDFVSFGCDWKMVPPLAVDRATLAVAPDPRDLASTETVALVETSEGEPFPSVDKDTAAVEAFQEEQHCFEE